MKKRDDMLTKIIKLLLALSALAATLADLIRAFNGH